MTLSVYRYLSVGVLTWNDVDVGAAPEDVNIAPLESLAYETNGASRTGRELSRQSHRLRRFPTVLQHYHRRN